MDSIKYIDIKKSYRENIYSNYKEKNISEHVKDIMKNDDSFSRFEIICDKLDFTIYNKLYFDIEGIDTNKPTLIYEIVDEITNQLYNFFNIFKENGEIEDTEESFKNKIYFMITENKNSHSHAGLSYHVIFVNVFTHKILNCRFVEYYIYNKCIGSEFIDKSVYSHNRLFRCVNQPGISKDYNNEGLLTNDKHNIIFTNLPNEIKNNNEILITCSVITYENKEYNTKIGIKNNFTLDKIKYEHIGYIRRNHKATNKNMFSNMKFIKQAPKQVFIFNGNVSSDDLEGIIKRKEQKEDNGKNEYDKAVVLLEISENLNEKMKTILNEIKCYYEKNNTFENFRLTKEQIKSLETIIENKI